MEQAWEKWAFFMSFKKYEVINIFTLSIYFFAKKSVLVISTMRFLMICVQPVWTKDELQAHNTPLHESAILGREPAY